MDPIAHTLTGAALAAAGLRRATPLATAALILGANAPDIDIVMAFAGDYAGLAHRRGWTHGILAVLVLPFLLTGLLLLWERWVRRRQWPNSEPARAGPLLAVAALGVVSHPILDWLNNYGLRWLMPFDGRWFYGDALFIIDPWVWLVFGGVLCVGYSRRPIEIAAWLAFWLLASALVLLSGQVPPLAQGLWLAGIGVVLAARLLGFGSSERAPTLERATRAALVVVGAYMAAAAAVNVPARAEVRAELAMQGIEAVDRVMVAPVPGNPFGGSVVAQTAGGYYLGTWNWLGRPRFEPADRRIPRRLGEPAAAAAAETLAARRFLTWSRFPFAQIDWEEGGGYVVTFADARYVGMGGLLGGPTIRLDRHLQPVTLEQ